MIGNLILRYLHVERPLIHPPDSTASSLSKDMASQESFLGNCLSVVAVSSFESSGDLSYNRENHQVNASDLGISGDRHHQWVSVDRDMLPLIGELEVLEFGVHEFEVVDELEVLEFVVLG